jgi:tyrosyl-tRNA synthetase
MTTYVSSFLKTLSERNYIHQMTDAAGLDARAANGILTAYCGFDCTAPSLHIGNLVGIMMLRRLQQSGHKPIVLMGGGTTKVGDPSGKDDARKLLTTDDINANKASIKTAFERFLIFGDGPTDAIMVDNADWLDTLAYIPFLRDVGKHFSVNRMLTMDSVKLRLERDQPLSFLEFNYMILQSYDFAELNARYNCALQIGGSDQWGNIIMGVDLTRRLRSAEVYGLTAPLITTSDGAKMGKTANGAVWLNEAQLPSYDYWQFWRNTADADVGKFLKLFTDIPMSEIARLEKLQGAEINDAKIILANAATEMARGKAAAIAAAETAHTTFTQGAAGADLPRITISAAELAAGISLIDLLADPTLGLAPSKGEAKRAITPNNAVSVNGVRVSDINYRVSTADIINDEIKLSNGKKKHGVIRVG